MAKTVKLLEEYNPNISRRSLTAMLYERFYNLFCGKIKIKGDLTQFERAEIYTRLWEFGSFVITEAKATKLQQEEEQSPGLVFLPYSIEKLSLYQFPMLVKNLPLEKSAIVDVKKTYTVGVDCALVFWSPYSRRHIGYGVKKTASRYVRQIVSVLMTINTNLLTHKLPYLIDCDAAERPAIVEALRQVFNDFPAVFAPSATGSKIQGVKLDTPYIIDKLQNYVDRVESQYLEEIGIDSAKNVSPGQDRLLLDEVNANNDKIACLRSSHIDTLNEGFADAKEIFGVDLKAVAAGSSSASVHEDIRNEDPAEKTETQKEEPQE